MSVRDQLFIGAMSVVPKNRLSRVVRRLASVRSGVAVRRFAARYRLDLSEAEKPIESYLSVLDLFTRRLRPGIRPIDPEVGALVSPVDGVLDACGTITAGRLLQAKGREYTLSALLASETEAARYEGGSYLTLYLSPRDYHRIHAPATGQVTRSTYVPGTLYPVNPAAVAQVDGLFARNERLITHLETERFGPIALVMVGATCVGHIKVVYDAAIGTNTGGAEIVRRDYLPPRTLERGDELGVFEMGSTVVLIVQKGVEIVSLPPGSPVRLGNRLGLAR